MATCRICGSKGVDVLRKQLADAAAEVKRLKVELGVSRTTNKQMLAAALRLDAIELAANVHFLALDEFAASDGSDGRLSNLAMRAEAKVRALLKK